MNRAILLGVTGLALLFAGFVYDLLFAGLPYQDPTPKQQHAWEFHKEIASWVDLGGLFLIGVSLLLPIVHYFRKLFSGARN